MGEARRRGVSGGYYGEAAPRLFVKAWIDAASDARVEFVDAQMADGTWILAASIGAGFTALLTADQARAAASAFMEALQTGKVPELADAIGDVVVALGAAADELERLHPEAPIETLKRKLGTTTSAETFRAALTLAREAVAIAKA